MSSNLAELIRKDCYIVCPNGRTVSSEYLRTLKNFYKQKIYQGLDGKTVGRVVVIWSNSLDVILPAVQAVWELGAAIAVHDFEKKIVTHPAFEEFYQHISLVIGPPDSAEVLPALPHVPALETVLNHIDFENNRPEQDIYQLCAKDYPDTDYILDQSIDGDTICAVSHTSGTTGQPKIVGISHANAIDLVKENIRLFEFTAQDHVLHYKTLHHGSLFLNYGLPAFIATNAHYWTIKKHQQPYHTFMQECIQKCHDQQLTKWLVPYSLIRTFPKLSPVDLSNTQLITVVGPTQDEMRSILEQFKTPWVANNFGCTELGTLAISKTNNSNVDQYSPTRFQHFNTMIEMELHERWFCARYVNDTEWKTIGDIVEIQTDCFAWHGRNNVLMVDDRPIDVSALKVWLESYLGSLDFVLVPDFELDQLYLALFDPGSKSPDQIRNAVLDQFSVDLAGIDYFDFSQYARGVKPSQPLLLYAFRNCLNNV
jgi:hypothetical protein